MISHALAGLFALGTLIANPAATELEQVVPLPAPVKAGENRRWSGADKTIDELALLTERAAKNKSPLALGLLYRLWNVNKLLERSERVYAATQSILAVRGADPLLRAHASYLAAALLERRALLDARARIIQDLGLVTRAMVIGPFENSAAQGHEEPFPPEVAVALDEAVPGKGHPVRWRAIKASKLPPEHGPRPRRARGSQRLAEHGVFELSSLLYPASEGSAYVLVALEAARPLQAALRTGSVDQLKVFLDGKELWSLDTRRGLALDQDAIPLSIPQGSSLLMLKSSWTGSNGRLLFRLTQPDGAPLSGLEVRGDRDSITRALAQQKKAPPKATHRVTAVNDALDRAIARAKGDERALALSVRADLTAVLGLYDRRKLPTPPERDLEAAIRLQPGDPTMRFFYAHRVEERDPALAHEQLEAALVSDPGHLLSLYKLGESARAAGRLIDARTFYQRAEALDPTFAPVRLASAELRFDSGADRELALLDLREAAEKYPSSAVYAELARMSRASDDRGGALRAAQRALELDFSDVASRSLLVSLLLEGGSVDPAIVELDRAINLHPWQLAHRARKAELLSAAGRIDEALHEVSKMEELFPDAPEAPALRAEIQLWKGDDAAARTALEQALALDPFQPELRRHLGALKGERGELEDEYTAQIDPLLALPVSPEEASFGAIYLADRTAIRLYENGQHTRFQQFVVRLKNPNLKDALRVHRLPYSPSREVLEVLSAERVRPGGEVIKASSINDEGDGGKVGGMYLDRRFKTIVFDDMAEGDLVNVRYRTDSVGQNMFGVFFGDMAALQDRLPKINLLYAVIGPKSRTLYFGTMRTDAPKIEEDEHTRRLIWSYAHVPALEDEPFLPPYTDVGMTVNVSTYQRWEDLGKWYAGLFAEQLELDAAAREGGRRAIAGAKDEAEKIRRLYAYVVKNTRYVGIELGIHGWKPFKASEVHRRRYGDCKDKATLLAALLRDNGIDATIALVRTSDRGLIKPEPATMWAFNHAITYVPSLDLFLDGTAEFSGSRELPWLDQGGMALVVEPTGKTRLTTLPESSPTDNLNTSSYTAKISRDGALQLKGREQFFGARASQLRQEFEEVEQRKLRLEKQLNQVFNGVSIEQLEFSDLANLEAPVHYDYSANIARYGAEERGRFIIPLTLFEHQVAGSYGSLAKRSYDLFSNHTWATRNVVRYELPQGSKLEQLPEGVSLDSKHISLQQVVREVPGGFETDDTVTLKTRRIPAADYEEFRRACLAIDRALGRSVVIRW